MNKCIERLYNGTDQRKPYLRSDVRYVSDPGGNNIRHQRYRYGTFHNSRTGTVKYVDLHAA